MSTPEPLVSTVASASGIALRQQAAPEMRTRAMMRLEEIADKLGVTKQHVVNLIVEGKLQAIDIRGRGTKRARYRVPVEAYRNWITSAVTTSTSRLRLLADLPRSTQLELMQELKTLLRAE